MTTICSSQDNKFFAAAIFLLPCSFVNYMILLQQNILVPALASIFKHINTIYENFGGENTTVLIEADIKLASSCQV